MRGFASSPTRHATASSSASTTAGGRKTVSEKLILMMKKKRGDGTQRQFVTTRTDSSARAHKCTLCACVRQGMLGMRAHTHTHAHMHEHTDTCTHAHARTHMQPHAPHSSLYPRCGSREWFASSLLHVSVKTEIQRKQRHTEEEPVLCRCGCVCPHIAP